MVRQAPKGLQAHHVLSARVDEVEHFGREKPAFARFLAGRNKALDELEPVLEGRNAFERRALERFGHGFAQRLEVPRSKPCEGGLEL